MPTIRLSTPKGDMNVGCGFVFENEERKRQSYYPYELDGKLFWDLPDTPKNRSQIRAEFPQSRFSFELVHVEETIQFKSNPAVQPSTLPSSDQPSGNADGDGSGKKGGKKGGKKVADASSDQPSGNADGDGSGNGDGDGTGLENVE